MAVSGFSMLWLGSISASLALQLIHAGDLDQTACIFFILKVNSLSEAYLATFNTQTIANMALPYL